MPDTNEEKNRCEVCDLFGCTCFCKCGLPHDQCICITPSYAPDQTLRVPTKEDLEKREAAAGKVMDLIEEYNQPTDPEPWEEELKGYECTGTYCRHETLEDHYIVDKDFISKLLASRFQEGVEQERERIRKMIFDKRGELMMKANGSDNKTYTILISQVNGMDIIYKELTK